MATIHLTLPHQRYAIRIDPGLLASVGGLVRQVAPHARASLVVDHGVATTHAQTTGASLTSAGFDVVTLVPGAGEEAKTLQTVQDLYGRLVEAGLERQSPLVALGGGVVGDTAGFVAATYLRGVPFVQCPTTLLAMVDASVGGKVGVNLPEGKNLVGAFYHPRLVVIDPLVLQTLPRRELNCGLAECVKHGVIRDPGLFDWIERNLEEILQLESGPLVELVRRNVQIKADVVMADEKEAGQRAHLNFGHTFAHAIESTQGYGGYHHGEAVALGMLAAARLGAAQGRCDRDVSVRIEGLLERIGLPTAASDLPATSVLLEAMARDKKVQAGRLRIVVPDRLGSVSIISDVGDDEIEAAWESLRA